MGLISGSLKISVTKAHTDEERNYRGSLWMTTIGLLIPKVEKN